MSTGITKAGLRAMHDSLVRYRPNSWMTLHIWLEGDTLAETIANEQARWAGIFGPQIDNRQHLGEDMCAQLTNYYPEPVRAHWVLWHDGTFMMSGRNAVLYPMDGFAVDLRKNVMLSAWEGGPWATPTGSTP